jgi:phosphomannomutase
VKAFKAYDIRGIYNKDFNKEDVYKIGFFLPSLLNADEVLVGRDVRVSSPEIHESLIAGITDAGADVCDIGLATTPMVYFATGRYSFDASVQITASHNPAEYNGIKVSKTDALPIGYDTGLCKLEKSIESGAPIIPAEKKGSVYTKDIKDDYIEFQKSRLSDISNLKIGIDCSNGMVGIVLKDILGDEPIYINEEPDGTFPCHSPNPLEEENCEQIKKLVSDNQLDVGIIFDGDADRMMLIDEKGRFVRPDITIGILGKYYLHKKGEHVLYDIRTSRGVTEFIQKMGAEIHMSKVGHAFAKYSMRDFNCIFGGELAGHYYLQEFYNCDSAILASIIVLDVLSELKRDGIKFSELVDEINCYANSGELNYKIENKLAIMENVKDYFLERETPIFQTDLDGYRLDFEDWWFNIRPSNTEPYLRLILEANTPELLKEKREAIEKLILE